MSVDSKRPSKIPSLWSLFSGSLDQQGRFIDDDGDGDEKERTKMHFDDLAFYKQLLDENGCRCVDIAAMCVKHNDYCHGIQAVYRLTFNDGRTDLRHGPENFYDSGYYSYHGPTRTRKKWIVMEEDEYLRGLLVNQGEVVDGITFVTNKRRVHCGGLGGAARMDMMTSIPPNMKVVAFCGTNRGVCGRIGFYSTYFRWHVLGSHILMRRLVDQSRAAILPSDDTGNLAFVMQQLTTINNDVFRRIMSFLA